MMYILLLIIVVVITSFSFLIYRKVLSRTNDLEERNKRLSALKKIYQVMMTYSTDLIEVAQKVTDAISYELGFEIGALALVDENKGVLKRVAMSNTQRGILAKRALPFSYESLEIPLNFTQNLSIRALQTGQVQITHDLYDIFIPSINKDLSKKIQETVHVKTSLIFPIKARGKPIGVMIISIDKGEKSLSKYEIESIENLIDVAGVAFDNAILYRDLKLTTNKLQYANQRLEELDKLKDDFVSIASHELRTPMTAIRSYVWMALHRSDIPLSQKLEKYLYRTLVSTERLINLVNDMLNVSRIESGSIEINPKSFNILELVTDVVEEVKAKADEKRLQLLVLQHSLPEVFADPDKVHEILLNLIGNSLKFTTPGGIITVDFFTDGKMIEVSVKDNGPGITRDDLSKLFHKFSRLDNSYTAISTAGGTGLGLFISKNLVELMQGKIWVSSEGIGKGATFSFSLPIANQEVLSQAEKYHIKPRYGGEAKGLEPVVI